MKRLITLIICSAMLLTLLAGCSQKPDVEAEPSASDAASQTDGVSASDVVEIREKQPGHYTFQTHVFSPMLEEIMGPTFKQTYFNFIDAVLAGEDTFACPDDYTYDWVMGQLPRKCFPVVDEYIEKIYGEGIVVDGRAGFNYKIPREEFLQKLEEFETIVTDILNDALEDDYSDFEKALALYHYFSSTYSYDYDTYNKMNEAYVDYTSPYRMLTEKIGICSELSSAYSYLLMQVGVDATTMSGDREYDSACHQWSFIRINGKCWHIDPTYAIGYETPMRYFMMTDEKRYDEDSYPKDSFVIASVWAQENDIAPPPSDDTTFSSIWPWYYDRMDTDNNILYCKDYDLEGNEESMAFDYGALGF